jgi:glycine/D-amino acid oxidase-like deaminating enzyme
VSKHILIVGGGVIGLCTAYYLAERGDRIGSLFEGHVHVADNAIRPTIRGSAYINAEATLLPRLA